MTNDYPRPTWRPSVVPTREWTTERMRQYLGGRGFTLYSHGTCVVWIEPGELSVGDANNRLRGVALAHPDFRVQQHAGGDYLVTFKGGLGGLMSGKLLTDNLEVLRTEAFAQGFLPSEQIQMDRTDGSAELDLVAGLYVRARLYQDIDSLEVVAAVR